MSYLPRLEDLSELPPPYEILETVPCHRYRIFVAGYELGKIKIKPRWVGAPPEKVIHCIRLHTTPEYKEHYPYYYDITPARLVGALYALLRRGIPRNMLLEIHRDVAGPRAHFSVRWVPIE